MPIYEYLCGSCGHVLDALQKVSEDPLTFCPECGKPELKRQLSAPAFRLKGGGWYETDFKDKNQKNVVRSDSESKPSSDTKKPKAAAEKKPANKKPAASDSSD